MFDWVLDTLGGSAWTYLIVVGVVAADAVFPIMPGETAAVTASILAAHGRFSIVIVVASAFVGAVAGDNLSYVLGSRLGGPAARRLFRGEKARRRLEWARSRLRQRDIALIAGARFIPGGRTAVTFSAGTLELKWRRFIVGDALGGIAWSLLACMIGYLGGAAFHHTLWKPLLVSLGASATLMLAGEGWRRLSGNRKDRASRRPSPVEEAYARLGDAEGGSRR